MVALGAGSGLKWLSRGRAFSHIVGQPVMSVRIKTCFSFAEFRTADEATHAMMLKCAPFAPP